MLKNKCHRNVVKWFAFLLLTLFLCVSCTTEEPSSDPLAVAESETINTSPGQGANRTLTILNPQAPVTLNPHLATGVRDREPSRIAYEPLASFSSDGETLIPFLAAEIPSVENGDVAADGKSVTWRLKEGVKWADGEPFTADDVLFTYEYVSNADVEATSASVYKVIESVEVVDDYTVKINFTNPNPAWALPFVGVQGSILPRHVFEPYNNSDARLAEANTLSIGTGPYQSTEPGIKPQEVLILGTQMVQTNKIIFEKNPNFREVDNLYFDQVIWRGGGTPDEAARLTLEAGSVDFAYQLDQSSPQELDAMAENGTGHILLNPVSRVDRILLNRTDPNQATAEGERSSVEFPHPFFSDKLVRQAFAHAINREEIAALYGTIGDPTNNNLVAPPRFNSSSEIYTFDLDKAAALLDEAGWVDSNGDGIRDKDGEKLSVVYQAKVSDILQQTQEIVKRDLESIGVSVSLKISDPSNMFTSGTKHVDSATRFNADIMEFSIRSNSPDPSAYMNYWTCGQVPQAENSWRGRNAERWCVPELEYGSLLDQAASELDPEKRAALFIQMNDMLIEDVVMIPVVYLPEAQGVSNRLEGVELTPWDASTWSIMNWRRVSE